MPLTFDQSPRTGGFLIGRPLEPVHKASAEAAGKTWPQSGNGRNESAMPERPAFPQARESGERVPVFPTAALGFLRPVQTKPLVSPAIWLGFHKFPELYGYGFICLPWIQSI